MKNTKYQEKCQRSLVVCYESNTKTLKVIRENNTHTHLEHPNTMRDECSTLNPYSPPQSELLGIHLHVDVLHPQVAL